MKVRYTVDLSQGAGRKGERRAEARRIDTTDRLGLAHLMLDAYRGTIDSEDETLDDAITEIDGWYAATPMLDHSRVIEEDGRLVSAVMVSDVDGLPFVGYVLTDPAHKGRGLGRAVVASAFAGLAEAGFGHVVLYITDGNEPSERLFRSLGAVAEPTPAERRESGSSYLLRFRGDETIGGGARRILASLTTEMLDFLADPSSVGPDVAVHEVRRRGKQARAALRLVRPGIDASFGPTNRRYRNAGRQLADARDARIVVETLAVVAPDDSAPEVRAALLRKAGAAEDAVFGASRSGAREAAKHLRRAAALVGSIEVADDPQVLADGSTATYAAGAVAYAAAKASSSAEDFHTWRKRVKDHRHQVAYLWECGPLDPSDHDTLYGLSDLLGEAHDLVVLREHLAVLDVQVPDFIATAVDERRASLDAAATALGDLTYGSTPTDYRTRLLDRLVRWRSAP